MKVDLLREPWTGWHNSEIGPRPSVVTRALPFYRSRSTRHGYVHRLRSGLVHYHDTPCWPGSKTHVSFRLWCGSNASSKHGDLLVEVPTGNVVCATCEGRAVANGQPSAAFVMVRLARFSPRVA